MLIAFALCAFVGGFASRLMDPLVLPVAQALAVSPATAATLATAYALPYAIFQPFLGALGDRFGKPRCMQVCVAGCTLALALGALAPGFGWLLASRVLAGLFAGGLVPLVLASLGDRYALVDRQVMIARMLFVVIGGQMLGAAIGGVVGAAAGWRVALLLAAAVGAAATVVAWRAVARQPPPSAPAAVPAGFVALYRQVFANPRSVWVYGCVAVEGMLFFGVFPHLGSLLLAAGSQPADVARQAGLVLGAFGAGGLVYALGVRALLQRLGASRMCGLGALTAALCFGGLALAPPWWLALPLMAAAGWAFGMIHNSLQTQATELAPAARGSAVALFAAGLFIGQGLGPLLFVALLHGVGSGAALLLTALALLALGQVVRRRVLG